MIRALIPRNIIGALSPQSTSGLYCAVEVPISGNNTHIHITLIDHTPPSLESYHLTSYVDTLQLSPPKLSQRSNSHITSPHCNRADMHNRTTVRLRRWAQNVKRWIHTHYQSIPNPRARHREQCAIIEFSARYNVQNILRQYLTTAANRHARWNTIIPDPPNAL